jgi:hypothetical protein
MYLQIKLITYVYVGWTTWHARDSHKVQHEALLVPATSSFIYSSCGFRDPVPGDR